METEGCSNRTGDIMLRLNHFLMLFAIGLSMAAGAPAPAAEPEFKPFFGTYIGKSISHIGEGAGLSRRDLTVVIKAKGKGFIVDWTTIIYKDLGKTKRGHFVIDFKPTERKGIYVGGTQKNLFGAMVPANPVAGQPYFWARIRGNILEVFGLHVNDAGNYEMQVYRRTLTANGMTVKFERLRDGKAQKTITGVLTKVE